MARPIEEFAIAWQALSGKEDGTGWRCIAVSPIGPCPMLAARRFPGNEEAVLAGFRAVKAPPKELMPEGVGFEVAREDPYGDGNTWIALTRKDAGSAEMFAEIVQDVVGTMDAVSGAGEEVIFRTMLSRVRAWQEFMRKTPRGLSPEAEIGLAGELSFLGMLLDAGIPAASAVEAWLGPAGGVQDFELGTGSIEVKSTLSNAGFPAQIGSLEQLDDSFRSPLYLAGLRFSQAAGGSTLGEMATSLIERMSHGSGAASAFVDSLVAAGLPPAQFNNYMRRFVSVSCRILEVREGFPRFVPGSVAEAVRRVFYELDLDKVEGHGLDVVEVLERLGSA
jgi:hypothetical protein